MDTKRYGSPCLFFNPSSGVACLVHGDDFLAVGPELVKFKEALAEEWKVKFEHIGERDGMKKEMGEVKSVDGSSRSPQWLQRRLTRAGVKPVNAVVDIILSENLEKV